MAAKKDTDMSNSQTTTKLSGAEDDDTSRRGPSATVDGDGRSPCIPSRTTIKPINQARQILMNELGLTREAIREEMVAIVEQTVDRHIKSLNLTEMAEKLIQDMLTKEKVNKWTRDKVHLMVQEKLQDSLKINVTTGLWG